MIVRYLPRSIVRLERTHSAHCQSLPLIGAIILNSGAGFDL